MCHVNKPVSVSSSECHFCHAVGCDSDVKCCEKPSEGQELGTSLATLPLRLGKDFWILVMKANLRKIWQLHFHNFKPAVYVPHSIKAKTRLNTFRISFFLSFYRVNYCFKIYDKEKSTFRIMTTFIKCSIKMSTDSILFDNVRFFAHN